MNPAQKELNTPNPHEQLSRLIGGCMTFYLGDEEKEVSAGDMIVITCGFEHGVLAHKRSVLPDIAQSLAPLQFYC